MKTLTSSVLALAVATAGLVSISPAAAEEDTSLQEALTTHAKASLNMRYRFETVDQDGFSNSANASTLRTKLSYKTGEVNGFSFDLQFENNAYLGDDDFNNTVNGNTSRPVIADPDVTELNHAYLTFKGVKDTAVKIGRQPINLDNQRFVGTVGWRQNDQTFDALTVENKSIENVTVQYSYIDNVNRIFGDDHPAGDLGSSSHLVNVGIKDLPFGKVSAYSYMLDFENGPALGLSSRTTGVSLTGAQKLDDNNKVGYRVEYASQSDYGDNPIDYSADYIAVEGSFKTGNSGFKLGYEKLGSDGGSFAFQTPLATLHKFNGFTDKFLNTPVNGLEDKYINASYKFDGDDNPLKGLKLSATYHDFTSDVNDLDYGSEIDIVMSKKLCKNLTGLVKFADYNADSFSSDTQKFVFQLVASY